ncbi:MAG: adenosine deaminase [Lachnospiraceae bacterium]|nr:adenosine deaminase [Lachnospiraceae bacterium]
MLQAKDYALIDLHLHLDGSISLNSVKELAELQGIKLSLIDEELLERLQVGEECKDLNEYLDKFHFINLLLQTKEAISTAVYNLEEELKEQGLIYAEIRFAPQLHTKEGLSQADVVEAAIAGMGRSDFHANLILCCMRGEDNHKENLETVHVAKKYLGTGVCAIDLAGAEALYPTEDFKDLFELATELEVPYTIHAGEAAGPESVYEAVALGTKRIGHGVRSLEDSQLTRELAETGVTLELCPTSNLNTNIFESMEKYPIRKLMNEGIKITINTDNMTVSGVTLQSELQKLMETFSLSEEELQMLVRNSVDAAFADESTKKWIYSVMGFILPM